MTVSESLDVLYGNPLEVVSSSLRAMLVPAEGNDFVTADFSAIEARVLAWLAGQDDVLDIFRSGRDIYNEEAAGIYGRPVDRKNNPDDATPGLVGKVSILALGYQGGIGAFAQMAAGYELDMEPVYPTLWASTTQAERDKAATAYKNYIAKAADPVSERYALAADITKQRWRAKNTEIVQYWYIVEDAAVSAILSPGKVYEVGRGAATVRYRVSGSFLWCQLPSGRCICYPYPKVREQTTPWGSAKPAVHFKGVDSVTKKWGNQQTYGGSLVENITQAVARDLLAEAIVRLERANYPVVLHVHDEAVTEVPEGFGSVDEMVGIMTELPPWADGLPIAAEGWRGKRYRK